MSGITQVYLHYNPGASGREMRGVSHRWQGWARIMINDVSSMMHDREEFAIPE